MLLATLAETVNGFGWICHAYCLMTNHYHLVVKTPSAIHREDEADQDLGSGLYFWSSPR